LLLEASLLKTKELTQQGVWGRGKAEARSKEERE
jgi:hypothetical protein